MGQYEKSIGKKKQVLFDAEMAKPFVVGEHVWVYQKDLPKKYSFLPDDSENTKTVPMTIKKIDGNIVILEYDDPGERSVNGDVTIDKSCLNKSLFYIGKNPYKMSYWQDKIHKHSFDNESIMYKLFPERFSSYRDVTKVNGVEVPETSFDPYVIDKNGNKRYFQRGYVWELKDKQSLIDSIYAGISCGEVVVRERSWKQVEREIANGNTEISFCDVVDGKQRINAFADFVQNKFPDSEGYYFNDLSFYAQMKVMSSMSFGYASIDSTATDEDVLNTFLAVNYLGVKQSESHLETIKKLKTEI